MKEPLVSHMYSGPPPQPIMLQDSAPVNPDSISDLESVALVRSLPITHQSGGVLLNQVRQSQYNLMNESLHAMSTMKDRLTIRELVSALLNSDEKVLNDGVELDFHTMYFKSVDGMKTEQHNSGKLVITNQRLLCLSSTHGKAMVFSKIGNPKLSSKVPGSHYSLTHTVGETMWFYPIPIKNFQHFSLLAKTGTKAIQSFIPVEPGCFGFCPCLCIKTWNPFNMGRDNVNSRVLTLSLYLPPWNEKYTIDVHIEPHISLNVVRNWVAVFNQSVRGAQGPRDEAPLPQQPFH